MPMKPPAESMRWVIAQLVVIASGVTVFIYVILPSHPGILGGGFLLGIGVLQVVFYRRTGRKFFARTQSSPHLVASFWAHSGERGTQLLFLGMGIILAIAGCILLVAGST
jgi:hypothetical protein